MEETERDEDTFVVDQEREFASLSQRETEIRILIYVACFPHFDSCGCPRLSALSKKEKK